MKLTRLTRKVDRLGRVVIPIEVRRELDIDQNNPLEIFVKKDCIILRKRMPKIDDSCVFCDKKSGLTEFSGKMVCKTCLDQLNNRND